MLKSVYDPSVVLITIFVNNQRLLVLWGLFASDDALFDDMKTVNAWQQVPTRSTLPSIQCVN